MSKLEIYIKSVYGSETESEKETKTEKLTDRLFKKLWNSRCSQYNIEYQPSVLPAVRRIIVLGDIHGDWKMTKKLLRIAKVIDNSKEKKWIGGDTVVVQVGDQVDRCRYKTIPCNHKNATSPDEANDWRILKFFTNLHNQAKDVGGAVYSLLGNHELMNVNHDFRYVSYEGLKEFYEYEKPEGYSGPEPFSCQDEVKQKEKSFNKSGKTDEEIKIFHDEIDQEKANCGKEIRKWVFEPGNPVSEFLACTRRVALIIGSNLFVHAGILPNIAKKYSIDDINQIMTLYLWDMLEKSSEYKDILDQSDKSPLWNRVFGNLGLSDQNAEKLKHLDLELPDTKKSCDKLMEPLKEIYNVGRIYVGHTPNMKKGMSSVCDGRLWLTDFGASRAFDKFDPEASVSTDVSTAEEFVRGPGRKAQVLEILDDGKTINILY